MLAYVFWHWRRPDVTAAAYERLLRAFHEALAQAPPAGFIASVSAAVRGAPWANAGGPAYEDWYLLKDSAALDRLNDAAVTASRARPHDAAAAAALGGAAGLYALRLGTPLQHPRHAIWFGKPPGVRYDDVGPALDPLVAGDRGALWMRRMVLGPAPEFCLQAATGAALPPGYDGRPLTLEPVWLGGPR